MYEIYKLRLLHNMLLWMKFIGIFQKHSFCKNEIGRQGAEEQKREKWQVCGAWMGVGKTGLRRGGWSVSECPGGAYRGEEKKESGAIKMQLCIKKHSLPLLSRSLSSGPGLHTRHHDVPVYTTGSCNYFVQRVIFLESSEPQDQTFS